MEILREYQLTISFSTAGNATKTQPDGGWDQEYLDTLFTIRTAASTSSSAAATSASFSNFDSGDSGLSGGAIAGIVIAVVAGLLVVAGAIFFWLRRNRRRSRQNAGPEIPEKDSLPSYSTLASQNRAELVGTQQAAELGGDQGTAKPPAEMGTGQDMVKYPPQEPVEKDAGDVGSHPSLRQTEPVEMP